MASLDHQPAPVWLVRTTWGSAGIAALAFVALLWAKWAVVLTMADDVIKYCF